MNNPTSAGVPEDFELTIETLDDWETELDQFASQMLRRLSEFTGDASDPSGTESSRVIDNLRDGNL
ncbi:hypothetical protein [Rhodopirellula sp. MGV]|uniref:hypothetical protein n=1 Tax=Rhodopirellula sp. MGV TaxID=2023130 RepID=UPI00117A7919|nr:hypothetical protein [Rhodopirellula sp. MGV]